MRVNRENFLRALESLTPGLSTRETVEQSSCIVFSNGRAMTFNEEILCTRANPVPVLQGAVKAKALLELLSKCPDDDVDVSIEKDGAELSVKGKGRKAGLRMESEVALPVESVQMPAEADWRDLPAGFIEAVGVVHNCASTDQSEFALCCVHIHPDYLEACDRLQIARYPIKTGVSGPVLVRASSLKRVSGFDMSQMAETDGWLHFRNASGLGVSVRRFVEDYKELDRFLVSDGLNTISLPGALGEIVSRAEIFSGENAVGNLVTVDLKADWLVIESEGSAGWFKERRPVTFNGDPIRFAIPPKLLVSITSLGSQCQVGTGRLFVDTGKFIYTTCTYVPGGKASGS